MQLTCCQKILDNIDKGLCSGAVCIDPRKAFDIVRHATLLGKLSSYGINDVERNWVGDYLFNRKQKVIFDNTSSCEENVTCGVPQGSIPGPLLFGLIINDIHIPLTAANILYADDTVLCCAGMSSNDIEDQLDNELQKVSDWLDENNLFIDLKKGQLNLFYMDRIKSYPNSQAWRSRSTIKLSMRQGHTSTLV